MRKIKWKARRSYPKDRIAFVNGVFLDCSYDNGKWFSIASIKGLRIDGEWFDSLGEAKEYCIRLARKILTDYHYCLVKVMKSFDIDCGEEI